MLSKNEILNLAIDFALKHGINIEENSGYVCLPDEEDNNELKELKLRTQTASVIFSAKKNNELQDDLQISTFIIFVNYITGEVHMPRHMV